MYCTCNERVSYNIHVCLQQQDDSAVAVPTHIMYNVHVHVHVSCTSMCMYRNSVLHVLYVPMYIMYLYLVVHAQRVINSTYAGEHVHTVHVQCTCVYIHVHVYTCIHVHVHVVRTSTNPHGSNRPFSTDSCT